MEELDAVPFAQVHHIEVAVDGQRGEEGDARPTVEEEHEEHGLALALVVAAADAVLVAVGLGWQADHQQKVSHHNVEEEHAVGLPELEP